jgi:uncharacterized membrane protein YkvA (DUF1232 family)
MMDDIDERLEELKRETAANDMDAAVAEDFVAEAELAGMDGAAADGDEAASEEAFLADDAPPSSGLLSFYDRLRRRILDAVERRGGKLGPAAVRALLLVPDVFILLVRLTLDREVPASARAMIGGALAYFILPIDLMPEAVLGAGGFLDDLVLATAVLAHTFSGELEPYARKHWSGPEDLRKVLADVAEAAEGLLGTSVYERMRRILEKRGVRVGDDSDDSSGSDD